ncbi:GAF domain-containing protein [Candidatus Daviesbacteria bacterium]|nr:GAF domain-containing protein [Candidatus Daviesbacteria bacterium]
MNKLKEELGWTFHSIFRLDEERQVVVIRFTGYLPDWYMSELSSKVLVRVGDASVGRAVATKQPATINTANTDPRFRNVQSLTGQTGYKSLSCYPLMGSIKTHGGFCTYSAYENIFSLNDVQFFSTCSNIFGAFLEQKLLEAQINKA